LTILWARAGHLAIAADWRAVPGTLPPLSVNGSSGINTGFLKTATSIGIYVDAVLPALGTLDRAKSWAHGTILARCLTGHTGTIALATVQFLQKKASTDHFSLVASWVDGNKTFSRTILTTTQSTLRRRLPVLHFFVIFKQIAAVVLKSPSLAGLMDATATTALLLE